MIKFECPILGSTATVRIIEDRPVNLPIPEATPFTPAPPIANFLIRSPRIDCSNKKECKLTDPNTGETDWGRCPASIAYEESGTLERLPGVNWQP